MPRIMSFLLAIALASTPLLSGCNRSDAGASGAEPAAEPADMAPAVDAAPPEAGEMTAQKAVETVANLAKQGALKVTLNSKYVETVTDRQPCSATEVAYDQSANPSNPELWRCKSSGGPTYFKSVTRTEQRCCKSKQALVPPDVPWTAFQSADDGKWHVTGDFSVEGVSHHGEFIVDGDTVTSTIVG